MTDNIPFVIQKHWVDDNGVDWAQVTHRDGLSVDEEPFRVIWGTVSITPDGSLTQVPAEEEIECIPFTTDDISNVVDAINNSSEWYNHPN